MTPGTSPSITWVHETYEVAFQANTGTLWEFSPAEKARNTGLSMAPGTSPSIKTVSNGQNYKIAFQDVNTDLWFHSFGEEGPSTIFGMAENTSPGLAGNA
jgi:hypothetical protein